MKFRIEIVNNLSLLDINVKINKLRLKHGDHFGFEKFDDGNIWIYEDVSDDELNLRRILYGKERRRRQRNKRDARKTANPSR